jgi:hypothetical protein
MSRRALIFVCILALLAFALLLLAPHGQAAPPPGADPDGPMGAWWRGAQSPAGVPCCGIYDGHLVRARHAGDGRWQVLLGEEWIDVPQDAVLENYPPHPSGSAAVWTRGKSILCFVPPLPGG